MNEEFKATPFLTRKMLAFENASTFALRLTTQSRGTQRVVVTGATKEGIFTFAHVPTGDGVSSSSTFNIPDLPIWVSVLDIDGSYASGSIYCKLSLVINGNPLHQLAIGTVNAGKGLSWPQSDINNSEPVKGHILTVAGDNAAAGDDVLDVVPTTSWWKLRAFNFTLVTDATVSSRRVHVKIGANGVFQFENAAAIDQTASQTRVYYCYVASGGLQIDNGSAIHIPIPPDLILMPDDEIITITTNLQAGDNFGAVQYYVEEYFNSD